MLKSNSKLPIISRFFMRLLAEEQNALVQYAYLSRKQCTDPLGHLILVPSHPPHPAASLKELQLLVYCAISSMYKAHLPLKKLWLPILPLVYPCKSLEASMQAQRKMVVSKKLMKVGPWGGAGGHPWDDGGYSGIRSITVSYDRSIDSISVEYDRNGLAVPGERHGGAGGNHTTQIKLSFPDEYLTAVSGHYSPMAQGGSPVIRSLAFRSSQRAYGPFGAAEGTPFTFPVDGGVIVGFCGRSGWQLDAVGLYVAALRPERVYDRVQKLGISAYRAVMHRIGPQQQQQQEEQVKQMNGNALITRKT
ncbi:hypothetical protein GQ55_3G186700 [Panicum hallii var. hallii]|uniref:Jacalin-type lectin domain-containing protein n=1 Tax=Panicum hallii var. hallii TaxID=1504633 RepID=A0A2T7EAZ4_9POAL|nr:hypothetical protein GQ55_3G186700 [Panicum hallii var. hallii]